ncbi:Leucine-rich repeat transmembrane protein kinase protein [Prunus dulcis]|uniref:Leucine-rich repeat transmembrane protein kinase protein n=1 Tax=Prunus dulcis TaxID=3755 RepID=A0A4Y1R3R6_PRUDU|nr:Leucine-rich repeat transmembrane protein kinase protein [Prunus dulcis]
MGISKGTGSGVPFISAIELRPSLNASYPTQVGSLALEMRFDTGQVPTDFEGYRYPFDVHDRFWYAYDRDDWTQLSTSQTIDSGSSNDYQPPPIVMRTAATPRRANASLDFFWLPADDKASYSVYMHFAEVEKLQANQSRLQYITRNGQVFYELFAPDYLYTNSIFSPAALSGGKYNFSIRKAENSTLPPILKAIEIYTLKEFLELETNQEDIDAINIIKSTYKIKKNGQGDPCAPQAYLWKGVKCSYPQNESPRIISLNLEKNKLTGSVPVGLIERRKNGFLSLSLCANPNLSGNVSCKKKRNFVIPVVASVAGISMLLLSVAALCWGIKRKRQPGAVTDANPIIAPAEARKRQFTYSEILQITNNLKRILGKGGFGTVYHGCIDKTEVAVKMLSPSSVQVNLLMRIHHINLTSLVGYCNDENHIGLVYEYMENGNLQAYLSGLAAIETIPYQNLLLQHSSVVLTWEGRLQIATDAAQGNSLTSEYGNAGLEYLHYCCSPPMIHRDVKSTNILLNEYFQAKLSDFGLSRNFLVEDGTHILTGVAGTPGYLAPEYNMSNRLNEKSDVYSFGVVLLEIIAGRPAFINTHERIHISKWVGLLLPKGDIYSIVDPRLERRFNVSSVWKAVELAMACVSKNPINRPSMSQVLVELKECLATELARTKQSGNHTKIGNSIEMMSQNSIAMRPSVR